MINVHKRWKTILIVVLLAVLAATAWQVLNRLQNSMVAGRPLSYPETHLHTVAISQRPGVVYLGTHYGIFTSIDGGRSWPQNQGDLNTNMITAIAISPTNPNLLAVLAVPTSGLGRQAGIYVSADAGKSWHFTLPGHLPASAYPYTIQGGAGANGRFYAFFTYDGWFETADLGQHWHAITSGRLASVQTPSLLTDPGDPNHLLMGGDLGLFETRDDGQNWQQINPVRGAVISLTASAPAGSAARTILCATDQGIYRWRDGQPQITQLNGPPVSSSPTRMLLSADGSALYALAGSDLWSSADQGTSWVHRWHFARSDLIALVIDPLNSKRLLASFFAPGLVLESDNSGISWQTLTA